MALLIIGGLWMALRRLGVSVLTFIQLAIASVLIAYIWFPIAVVYGIINLLYKLVTGMTLGDPSTVMAVPKWGYHQFAVMFGFRDDFMAHPYA